MNFADWILLAFACVLIGVAIFVPKVRKGALIAVAVLFGALGFDLIARALNPKKPDLKVVPNIAGTRKDQAARAKDEFEVVDALQDAAKKAVPAHTDAPDPDDVADRFNADVPK